MSDKNVTDSNSAQPYVEVWGDRVRLRDLVLAIAITTVTIGVACVFANLRGDDILFWGMGGAIAGFIVSSIVIRPKRDVVISEGTDIADATLTNSDGDDA